MFSTLLATTDSSGVFAVGSMEGLGDLPGGGYYSTATDISGDGTTVVGTGSGASGTEAFRWTSDSGMVGLGDLPGGFFYSSHAYGVSHDGSVVVGYSSGVNGFEAFRWTEAGGMVGLGDLPGGNFYSGARDVSDDGNVVVGYGTSAASGSYTEAFRWTSSGGMQGLGDLAGGAYSSSAYGVSGDGGVVVGRSASGAMGGNGEAFRWTEASGMVGLGALTGGSWSHARAVSRDGSVVVGESGSSLGSQAFRWTGAGGMAGLGILAGYDGSYAYGVDSNGSVVVGYNENDNSGEITAFRWTEAGGMQSLAEWLAESDYALTGWSDTMATGVSDDGDIVVGHGQSASGHQAFIARGGDGLIGVNSFSRSLQSAGSAGGEGVAIVQTILHGAHGHPGANRALGERGFAWVAGDLSRDQRHESDDDFTIGEVGAGYRLGDTLSVSTALGKSGSDSDLLYGGSSEGDGTYLALDADLLIPGGLPLYATLTWLYSRSDLEIERGYLNAGVEDSSRSDTQQRAQALRARLQWQSAYQGGINMHPYAEYSRIRVETDGYTESGGGFPAVYADHSETVRDWRLGADLDKQISDQTRLIGTLEAVHRMEKNGNGVSGQVVGLSSFEVAGRSYDQDWLRATLGVERTFDQGGRLSLTLNTSSEGEDPQVWAGINYGHAFF
jgi:probable HAF family extracellular repeat protein